MKESCILNNSFHYVEGEKEMSIWKGWMKQEDYPNLQPTQTFETSSLQSNLPLKKKGGGWVV